MWTISKNGEPPLPLFHNNFSQFRIFEFSIRSEIRHGRIQIFLQKCKDWSQEGTHQNLLTPPHSSQLLWNFFPVYFWWLPLESYSILHGLVIKSLIILSRSDHQRNYMDNKLSDVGSTIYLLFWDEHPLFELLLSWK